MGAEYSKRYTEKVAQLRKSDLRIDWSEVKPLDGQDEEHTCLVRDFSDGGVRLQLNSF